MVKSLRALIVVQMQNLQSSVEYDGVEDVAEADIPDVASTVRETPERMAVRRRPSRRHQRQQQRPLLLRRWLQRLADNGDIPGLEWVDNDRTLLRIPWCHGSRSEWSQDHSALFRAWAEYKGL